MEVVVLEGAETWGTASSSSSVVWGADSSPRPPIGCTFPSWRLGVGGDGWSGGCRGWGGEGYGLYRNNEASDKIVQDCQK